MADVDIIEQDRIDAENFLEAYLTDKVPEGDFGKGSALRDFAITAVSNIFAYLRKKADTVRQRQSLLLLGEDEGDDVDDAVDEILSNWFLTRKTGRQSRGIITIYFSQAPDSGDSVVIAVGTPFYKTASLIFVPDSDTDLAYSAEDMTPVTDSNGNVVEYGLRVPVIAAQGGAEYDIEPGPFVNYGFRHLYVTRVENLSNFSGGESQETTSEMLDRSPTAISVRDFNSARSIDALLKDEFSQVDDVTVIGFGDNEMIRDLIEEIATGLRIHAGGYTDAYLRNPIVEDSEYVTTVGAAFTDPRPHYYVLRDETVADFTTAGPPPISPIVRGDIINVYNNLAGSEAGEYIVTEATKYGLLVSRRSPFPMALPTTEDTFDDGEVGTAATGATDRIMSGTHEFVSADVGKWVQISNSGAGNDGTWVIDSINVSPNYAVLEDVQSLSPTFADETGLDWELLTRVVDYSVGTNSPDFDNKVPRRLSGQFTKTLQKEGSILLPEVPVYRIRSVYVDDATDPDLSDASGHINFVNRVNTDTVAPPNNPSPPPTFDPTLTEYRVFGRNPGESYSGWQTTEVQVGWVGDEARYDDKTIHVRYDTISGYESIWEYAVGTDRRLSCASIIPKGMHPVYLGMTVQYRLAKTATEALDEDAASDALAAHIDSFDTRLDLDVSDITSFLRENYDVIGYIAPLTINYDLLAPDGRVIYYQTTDVVTVDPSKYHPDHLAYPDDQLDDPLAQGVSDNTLRYLSAADLITFEAI